MARVGQTLKPCLYLDFSFIGSFIFQLPTLTQYIAQPEGKDNNTTDNTFPEEKWKNCTHAYNTKLSFAAKL